MTRCRCAPPLNPLGDANAEPRDLWQCPLCDRWWRAQITMDTRWTNAPRCDWTPIQKKHLNYYLRRA